VRWVEGPKSTHVEVVEIVEVVEEVTAELLPSDEILRRIQLSSVHLEER